jgi:hypothetical protein
MKKIALLSSLAMLALGFTLTPEAPAQAQCYKVTNVLQCGWNWHGYYLVKNFTTTYEDEYDPERGDYCADVLNDNYFGNEYKDWYLKSSTGNSLTDTYVFYRVEDCG